MKTTNTTASTSEAILYRMVTDTPIFGRSKILTKKEWEKQYGYNIGNHRIPNVRFERVPVQEPKEDIHLIRVNNKNVIAKVITKDVEPMLISEVEPIYKGDFIAYQEDGKWLMERCKRLRGLDHKEIMLNKKWHSINKFRKVLATKLHLKDDILENIYQGKIKDSDAIVIKTDTIREFEDLDNSDINIIHTDAKGYVELVY